METNQIIILLFSIIILYLFKQTPFYQSMKLFIKQYRSRRTKDSDYPILLHTLLCDLKQIKQSNGDSVLHKDGKKLVILHGNTMYIDFTEVFFQLQMLYKISLVDIKIDIAEYMNNTYHLTGYKIIELYSDRFKEYNI